MAAQSMDDSTIRDLERQCQTANAEFHKQADSTIKHAGILERQVSSGKLGSSQYRVGKPGTTSARRRVPTGSAVMKKPNLPDVKV